MPGQRGIGQHEVVGPVAVGVGIRIAFLVGGNGGVVEPGRENAEDFGLAGVEIEIAAERDVVVRGEGVANELKQMAGFRDASLGPVVDKMNADDVQGAGAGYGDGPRRNCDSGRRGPATARRPRSATG